MKFKVHKTLLTEILARAHNIVEKKNTMPVLVNVMLEASEGSLKVFATDLEVSLIDNVEVECEQPGAIGLNAKHAFEIIKEFNENWVELERKENYWLEIRQNKSIFNIVGLNPDEYPIFPAVTTRNFIPISVSLLREMIEKTIYSVSNDATRYHLNGVYFEQFIKDQRWYYRMVATDGHRLSLVDREIENMNRNHSTEGVIVPRKGLYEIRKLLEGVTGELELAIEGSQLIFKKNATVLMVRLIEGRYPNYQQFIPQNVNQYILLDKEALQGCLRRVSLLSNQKSKAVTFTLCSGRLEITSSNPELGNAKEELEVSYAGKEIKVGLNARYILDILNSIEDKEIEFGLSDNKLPSLLRPNKDGSHTCVVMPMRI